MYLYVYLIIQYTRTNDETLWSSMSCPTSPEASPPFARPLSPPRPPGRCTGRPIMQRPRGVVSGGYPNVD